MSGVHEALPRPSIRRDTLLRAMLSSLLFLYMGFILAVIFANALWLTRPQPDTGQSYLSGLLQNAELRDEVGFSIKLSFITSGITALLGMLVGIPSAYALSRFKFRFAAVIDTIIDLPIVIPPLIAGVALLLFFKQSFLGKLVESNVIEIVYTPRAIVVAQFFVASAFAIRALKATFDQINPRFEWVARSLGCTPWQAMWKITLPLARNGVMAGLVMTWTRAMGEFGPIMMLAGATPHRTAVLPITAFLNMSTGNVEAAIAIVVLMILISAVTLITFKRLGGQGYLW